VSYFLLDTDHLTLLQQLHPQVRQRIRGTDPATLAITIISAEEQMRGWLDAIRRHNGSPRQIWAYQGLREMMLFLQHVLILPFDQAAYQQFEALRQQKIRIGSQDLRIASIALTIGATLVTRNKRDFEQVPGLTIEDWSLP
jgi:tRNA(fMet)-specific endonuclease VapC